MPTPITGTAPSLRETVLAARVRLVEGRDKARLRHQKGVPALQICGALTDLFDSLILDLYESALRDLDTHQSRGMASQLALVCHGGYGRCDMAPYSDIDLMILHAPGAAQKIAPLAERMVRDLFDAGLVLGQSVRTPVQACQMALKDAAICTSLVESRFLAGSVTLFRRFMSQFQLRVRRRSRSLLAAICKARLEERAQYGETVYLLEPNLKRSRGGLRDIQLLRWIGFARYGTAEPDELRLQGVLSEDDYTAIRQATDFLLRLRNEMHFHAGRTNDVLDRVEQLRLAETFGYQGEVGLLPVEQFMREYFRFTHSVSHIVTRFVAGARLGSPWGRMLGRLFSHSFEGDFRVGPTRISANRRGIAKLAGDLAQILRLVDLSNLYNKTIDHPTFEAIRSGVRGMPDEVSAEAAQRFLSLLSQPARLGDLLRALHEMGVLEKIIPAFAHARSLLQFNEYHKYTVDEHCLLAVERATEFGRDEGPVGRVYRHIKRKWLLHLALLLHDLGKGFAEDHSEVGLRIANDVAGRLGLSERDSEGLCFLVHKHLLMSHLAFRRDTSDERLVVRFAVEVGSPELMQMLFVLTAADLGAVGPGVLNAWKIEVLANLHHRAMQHLAGDAPAISLPEYADRARELVRPYLAAQGDAEWFEKQLAALPASHIKASDPAKLAGDLIRLHQLKRGEVVAVGRYQPETATVEYKVGTYDDITPGVFHKLAGALSGKGLQVLSADIHTLADGLVFDRFFVQDPDFAGQPPAERLAEVCRALETSLLSRDGQSPVSRRVWRAGEDRRKSALPPLPSHVRVDNSTSDEFTILDIFAADRTGLLYTISRSLFQSGLSVSVAKIGTYLDQVVDVFYVTDQSGHKILDERRLSEIRARLLEDIEEFERAS